MLDKEALLGAAGGRVQLVAPGLELGPIDGLVQLAFTVQSLGLQPGPSITSRVHNLERQLEGSPSSKAKWARASMSFELAHSTA